ncbi:hypothetical protein SERLA73DRAFT_187533 [Serpula lacrymans var. lacrymans S7.3]|uniref:Methyltransferase domain-containing protein n=2 Tax=Serpula lacrymans var. lacrymans TaxID=341189 RepID=F8Q9F1_SERL3|nr:uncharacterized protein SERLADRAFT_477188 [Serpula lacrymans var. lacrymans S7.9]EGN95206.1 hypothetical protein SERLA73DRAFT_187533 [Serpula lacrymans var. lacrymans S7.3]EGO20733.1 hypothetical protein SERLADRAFT_477188 [Serpula lacrymans var. lacrymans S7.9]
MDPKDIVRQGYDALSLSYRGDRSENDGHNQKLWTSQVLDILPSAPAKVLDIGCGCGVPASRELASAGYSVTGVDISKVQVDRARNLVPEGTFIQADIASESILEVIPITEKFSAVIAFYVLIHIPVGEQSALIHRMSDWVEEGGYCAMVVGITPWTGEAVGWLGKDVKMWWSQASIEEYRKWVKDAGFEILREEHAKDPVSDGSESEGHQFLLLRKVSKLQQKDTSDPNTNTYNGASYLMQ